MSSQQKKEYNKQRYANLSAEKKLKKIQAITAAAQKRKESCLDEQFHNCQSQKRQRKKRYFLGAQLTSSSGTCISNTMDQDHMEKLDGVDELYEPVCSELHNLVSPSYCGFCGAKKFQYEPPTLCCYNGEVDLAPTAVPDDLYELFRSQSKEAIEFRRHIRLYNSIFSFTSFGVHLDKDLASLKNGVYTFRALGQVYHYLPGLARNNSGPCYLQLYIYDTENEVKNRMNAVEDAITNEALVRKLMEILSLNPYVKFFRNLRDVPSLDDYEVIIKSDINLDQRVYNAPTASQVAAIWIEGNTPSGLQERDIIINTKSGKQYKVKHYFGCYDPLQYPILFPYGEVGWHQNIKKRDKHNGNNKGQEIANTINATSATSADDILGREETGILKGSRGTVSCRQYYSYKLQIRDEQRSIILHAGRLLQQYVVDMYIKLESTRMDFFRKEQAAIRADLYQGIVDSVQSGENKGQNIGRRIVLPASFIGGPRDMRRRYLNAMALVQRYGKPDLFITMTCNPDWKEIKDELAPGQLAQDRPDLTSRIFRAKIEDLKDQLFKKSIFGPVAAHVYVIEFQKRGLPHAHILVILKSGYKINSPDQYDRVVCAEIPDTDKYKELHNLVVKHMMHGPCGHLNEKNPCMRQGACKDRYPRLYSPRTVQGKDSYPIYRRRDDGRRVKVRKQHLDNRWVVPYNPYLLTRYNCHINIEICSGLKAVKYLYKYLYKGHDRVCFHIAPLDGEKVIDEIQQYQNGRWVSPPEAIWRIFEFDLNEMYPSVKNLQLHLPNMQSIYYTDNQDLRDLLEKEDLTKTMLTQFFEMNTKDEESRKYLYREIPEHYVWNSKQKTWTTRKKQEQIGRINTASPLEGERYYLRLLLNHVRGPKSFNDLLTVNGVKCSTFKESAEKRGLLDTDDSLLECLRDASTFQMPSEFRRLFAIILVYCEPSDVRKLWEENLEPLSQDIKRIDGLSEENIVSRTLVSIDSFLESMGKSTKDYDLPMIEESGRQDSGTRVINDELNIEIPTEDLTAVTNLNPEQETAFTNILKCVNSKGHGVFFIDGPGGTGKTYLYRALLAMLRSRGLIAIATATSGVAAAIMPGGRTAHSRFKIPINITESSICNIPKQSGLAELLRKSSLIIWDEAPMAKRTAIEALDRSLKDIMTSSLPFGGKVVVFGGDFRQVLPVVPRATRAESISASLVRSYVWPKLEVIRLQQNMRARADLYFSDFLLRIGNGDEPTIKDDLVRIPDEMVIKYVDDETSENALINSLYHSLEQHATSSTYITQRAILAAKNDSVDSLNEKLIARFPGDEVTYYSFDSVVDNTQNFYQEEFLNSLTPNGLPPHKLLLKKNCPIMLLRNLDPSNGLCNGTRLVCRGFEKNVIHAEIAVGQFSGKYILLPRIPLSPAENEGYPFQLKRKQFPIRLSFAMTINKAQGQTIPHVGVYLPQHVFSHGQLYVALSRGVSMSTTKVLIKPNPYDTTKGPYTKNVVYKEVLMPNRCM